MKTKERWQQHLSDAVNASLDPLIYAVQWARDPRCLQSGASHRRVGRIVDMNVPVCPLWSLPSKRGWE